MLAPSPTALSDCGNVVRYAFDLQKPEFTMTNKGLRMELELLREADTNLGRLHAPLNCSLGDNKPLGVRLRRVFKDRFLRMPSRSHITLDEINEPRGNKTVVYAVNRQLHPISINYNPKKYTFEFTTSNLQEHGFGFPGIVFVGNPKHSQNPVDGITNIKLCLAELKRGARDDMSRASVACEFVTFLSKKKVWERCFTVCLAVSSIEPSISLLIPVSPTRMDCWHAFSRASAPLHSGMSVNVALKEREDAFGSKVIVDITIDPEGKLRWHRSKSEGLNARELGFDELSWS